MSNKVLFWGGGALAVVFLVGASLWYQNQPGKLDTFAQCLDESGTTFYGAFWCQHCQDQKALFGNSAKQLPYVECSTPNAQGQLEVCQEAGITGYPTWEFEGGKRLGGVVSLQTLSEETGCALPG